MKDFPTLDAEAIILEREAAEIREDSRGIEDLEQYAHNIRCAEARELRATIIRCTQLLYMELPTPEHKA